MSKKYHFSINACHFCEKPSIFLDSVYRWIIALGHLILMCDVNSTYAYSPSHKSFS